MAIALSVEPAQATAVPGGMAVYTVRVANQGHIVDRVAIEVLGPAAEWAAVEPAEVSLFPGADGTATITLTPPAATPAGPVAFGLRASAEASGDVEVGEATLEVGASHTVESELRPRTATGKRRASSMVVVHNTGNSTTAVEVVPSDPDDAIVFDGPGPAEVGPGTTAELPLRMRLPGRQRQGATLPYVVVVRAEGTAQSLDGQVRQPPRRMWPVVAALAVLALGLIAFSRLRPEDSVALTSSEGDDAASTTAAGSPGESTTTAPGAGTSAPPDGGVTTTGGPKPSDGGGGPTTTAGQVQGGSTTVPGIPSIPRPTTTTRAPLTCPAKGDAKVTAERVVCAWELGRLSEVRDSTTPDGVAALSGIPITVPGRTNQAFSRQTTDPTGTTVFFGRCGNARGVESVRVASTGADAGRVVSAQRCPPVIG